MCDCKIFSAFHCPRCGVAGRWEMGRSCQQSQAGKKEALLAVEARSYFGA
ncbi:MAG: hypothetical protein KME18_02785 [Phormidium tanganyikae FI6-MK23]|nr:hypothetical protein [Phormidium tanganyikae FI6-MK23]